MSTKAELGISRQQSEIKLNKRLKNVSNGVLVTFQLASVCTGVYATGNAFYEGVKSLNTNDRTFRIPEYATNEGRAGILYELQKADQELCGLVVTDGKKPRYDSAHPEKADEIVGEVMGKIPVHDPIHEPLLHVRENLAPHIQSEDSIPCNSDVFLETRTAIHQGMEGVISLKDLPETKREYSQLQELRDRSGKQFGEAWHSVLLLVGSIGTFTFSSKVKPK